MSAAPKLHRLQFIQLLEDRGFTHEETMDLMRGIFGLAESRRIEREYAEQGTKHARAMANRRDKTVKSSWRLLLKPLNAKIRALKFQGPRRPTEDEQQFYELARRALEKTQVRIETQRMKADALTDKCLSPAVVARQLGLPNSGLYWVDWVPDDIRKAIEAEEARIHAARTVGAKAPGIFRVSRDQRQVALRAQHFVTLNNRIDSLRAQMAKLPGDTDPVRKVHMQAEISVYKRALSALDAWPTHRVLPVDPVAVLGVNVVGLTNAVEAARSEIRAYAETPDGIDPANLERLVEEAYQRAKERADAAKATAARRAAGIRKVRKDRQETSDEA